MGDYSRDPKKGLADSIEKHYIGVRMQQGVPILDADWNELEDLRRREFETMGTWFIGSGVPSGNDGFFIFSVSQDNDFGIRNGMCLVNGKVTENTNDTRYTTQPNYGNADLDEQLPPLTTPATDKQFIVYLDVWEREVDSNEDSVLIDSLVGVETTLRLKREWAVRVARVPEDLVKLENAPPGHVYYPLARLNRKAGNDSITKSNIEDLRDTQISVKRKIELRNSSGDIVVDNNRFKLMLENTRNNVLALYNYITTEFNPLTAILRAGEVLGLQTVSHIARAAETGIGLVNSDSIANRGALHYFHQLYEAENNFVTVWKDVVLTLGGVPKKYATYADFVTRVDNLLHQTVVGDFTGLLPALEANNLEAATATQEVIAGLFGIASASIARGNILVYLAKSPSGNLMSGDVARFEFSVRSFTTMADSYTVRILPPEGWSRDVVDSAGVPVPGNRVTIGASGTITTILVDVTVQAGSSGLQLRVTSDSNPSELDQLTGLYTLTEGQPAPVGEDAIQLFIDRVDNGTLDGPTGEVSIQREAMGIIEIRVFNYTGEDAHFDLSAATENEIGSWTVEFSGAPSLEIPDQESLPKAVKVTPGADAISALLTISATADIAAGTATGRVHIQLNATV